METATETRPNILGDAQDIAVIENLGNGNYIYAAKPSLDVIRQLYDLSVANPEDREIPVFQRRWEFDEQIGIRGSSTYLALRFDKLALRPSGLWLPGLLEAKTLDKQGKLENGVYRDYGVVVYSNDSPNKRIAESLAPQAEVLKLRLPLVNQFRALDYNPNNGGELDLSFVQSPKGIISGEEAQKQINSLDYKSNSGVHRLSRGGYGGWGADWDDLDGSYDYGRVDWICGEATRADLVQVHKVLLERKYGEVMRKERENFGASLSQ